MTHRQIHTHTLQLVVREEKIINVDFQRFFSIHKQATVTLKTNELRFVVVVIVLMPVPVPVFALNTHIKRDTIKVNMNAWHHQREALKYTWRNETKWNKKRIIPKMRNVKNNHISVSIYLHSIANKRWILWVYNFIVLYIFWYYTSYYNYTLYFATFFFRALFEMWMLLPFSF